MRASLAFVRSLLDEHSAEPLPLRALAEAARMSPFTLNRTFREQYGLPPHEYLNLVRVKRGQDLLRRGDRPLAELALDLGFADQAHFTRIFKRHVGVPPGRYRGSSVARPQVRSTGSPPPAARPFAVKRPCRKDTLNLRLPRAVRIAVSGTRTAPCFEEGF
jgi:AraC-like DNA-binding protein